MMQLSSRLAVPQLKTAVLRQEWARSLATAVGLFLLFSGLFALIQFATPGLAGNDGYYHIKVGYLMRQEGLTPAFDALPYTILNAEAYYDHHLLYHVFLSLFATVDPRVDGGAALTHGAKLASVVMPALAFLAIWWLLRGQKVPGAALWAIALFAVSEAFLYRMSMPRAQSASLLLLALALHWLLQEKYRLLIPLGFAYVWFYNAFPLLLVVAGIYVAAVWLRRRRLPWQALLYPALGVGLGLLINPYFPENVAFIIGHLAPKVGDSATRVGNEWSPYRTWTIVRNSGPALAAMVCGALALGWREERVDTRTLFAFALATLFGYMLFKSRRFVEYFPPFALIFLALAAAPLLQAWREKWEEKRPLFLSLTPLLALLLLAYPLYNTLGDARDLIDNSKPADRYAAAALWLADEAEPGAMIFQTDWDDFTRLYFYNSDLVYTAGLDPTFMERYDAELFRLWVDITRGDVDEPGAVIRDRFGAEYVFSDLKHDDFIDEAAEDPLLEEVFRTDDAVIFAVRR
jgi:hypothetical protein